MGKTDLEIRDEIAKWIERAYLGPFHLDEEQEPLLNENISFSPLDMYSTGILFPQSDVGVSLFSTSQLDDASTQNDDKVETGTVKYGNKQKKVIEDDNEDDLRLTTEFYPSSIAISSLIYDDSEIDFDISCGKYISATNEIKEKTGARFTRVPITISATLKVDSFEIINEVKSEHIWTQESKNNIVTLKNDEFGVTIKIIKRTQYGLDTSQTIITISVINSNEVKGSVKKRENCLFQPKIVMESIKGFIPFPDNSNLTFLSAEEVELKFLYRKYKNYCIGHGCASDWHFNEEIVNKIESAIIPKEKINGVDFNPTELEGNDEILFMKTLTDFDSIYDYEELIKKLKKFASIYKDWIEKQQELIRTESLNKEFDKASVAVLKKCNQLYNRMVKGIDYLTDKNVLRAFLDANKAMFMQRVLADFSKHRNDCNRTLPDKKNTTLDDELPNFSEIPFNSISGTIWKEGKLNIPKEEIKSSWYLAKWRPFQLAFILSQIEGIVSPDSEDRETVDLLWFPTGGGKTEAYLGLIAFTIFYQRLTSDNSNQGVSVIMRYTLRMLNKQQFDRANILICACELIRYENIELYGVTRISNGLWVGGSFFPNKHAGSKDFPGNNELLESYKANVESKTRSFSQEYGPAVFNCPCCGNKLVKELTNIDNKKQIKGEWGYNRKRNRLKRKPFQHNADSYNPYYLHCTNSKCHFYLSEEDFFLTRNESAKIDNYSLPIYYVDEDVYKHRPTLLFSTVDKYAQLAWKKEVFRLFNLDDDFTAYAQPPTLIVQDELHLISSSLGTIYSLFEFVIDELSEHKGIKPKIVGATATVRNAEQQCIKIYNRKKYSQFPPVGVDIDDSFYSRKKINDVNGRLYLGVMSSGNTSTTAKLRLDSLLYEGVNLIQNSENSRLDNYYTLLAYFNTVKELGKYRTLLEDDMNAYRKFLSKHLQNLFMSYNPNRIVELSSQMTADEININLDRLENTKLQEIDIKNEINIFLRRVGITTRKDLELANYKWIWVSVFMNYWEDIKKISGLDDKDKIGTYPIEENKLDVIFDKCYPMFIEAMSSSYSLDSKDPVKVAMATNMISVGVDIPRLNVMSISGQPKTTAEYIQASSRVGRKVPGVVFTLYNQAKNRDRSHYENFKDYHQAYYKYVESTSVTPFSIPALEKTLDSIVIALMRGKYFKQSNSAYLDKSAEIKFNEIREKLIQRFLDISSVLSLNQRDILKRKTNEIGNLFDELLHRWKKLGDVEFTQFKDIMNDALSDENLNSKLFLEAKYRDHQMTKGMLFAMTSLRDVDTSSKIKLKSYID